MENKEKIEEIKKDLLLEELVEINANSEKGKDDCVEKLQEISKKLLQEYEICVGDYTIAPLLIEAYYYNEHKGFKDENTHLSEKQKNRFGKLYFHERGRGRGRGGMDICLSAGDYYLSFLIKNSLVTECNEEPTFFIQTDFNDFPEELKSSEEFVLKKRDYKKDSTVFCTVRRNLNKKSYKDEKLAAVTGFELRDKNQKPYEFTLETGHTKETLIIDYIKNNHIKITESEFKEKYLDYIPTELKGILLK